MECSTSTPVVKTKKRLSRQQVLDSAPSFSPPGMTCTSIPAASAEPGLRSRSVKADKDASLEDIPSTCSDSSGHVRLDSERTSGAELEQAGLSLDGPDTSNISAASLPANTTAVRRRREREPKLSHSGQSEPEPDKVCPTELGVSPAGASNTSQSSRESKRIRKPSQKVLENLQPESTVTLASKQMQKLNDKGISDVARDKSSPDNELLLNINGVGLTRADNSVTSETDDKEVVQEDNKLNVSKGRRKIESSEGKKSTDKEEQPSPELPTPKRKRGRAALSDSSTPKRKGRPRLSDSSAPAKAQGSKQKASVSGSRGSGRRSGRVNYSELDEKGFEANQENTRPTRRRQPSKRIKYESSDASAVSSSSSEEEEVEEEEEEEEAVSEPAVKDKKRGTARSRQREVQKNLEKNLEGAKKAQKSGGSLHTCSRCSKEYTAQSTLKQHMALDHQALWTKDSPDGCTDLQSLKEVIKLKKFLNCPKCDKRLNFFHYYKDHVQWCGNNETYSCSECGSTGLLLKWQKVHQNYCSRVRQERAASLAAAQKRPQEEEEDQEIVPADGNVPKRKAAKRASTMLHNMSQDIQLDESQDDDVGDPDVKLNASSESENEEESGDEVDEEDEEESSAPAQETKFIRPSRGPYNKCPPGVMPKYCPMYDRMVEFTQKHRTEDLYPHLLPSRKNWSPVSELECSQYKEMLNVSPEFAFQTGRWTQTERQSLEPLSCTQHDGFPLFSTGHCVCHMAWCPSPQDRRTDQYVAIACKLDRQKLTGMLRKQSGREVIQIWHLGIESNERDQSKPPSLCYVISHDFGHVTDMAWCPSGCWDTDVASQREDVLPRLGLLAVSCTDATVRIFSVPKLEDNYQGHSETSDSHVTGSDASRHVTVFHPTAAVTLVPSRRWESLDVTCSCLAWCPVLGHRTIVAGYSDGTVRVFDLLSDCPLLKLADASRLPHLRFKAHSQVVRSTCWLSGRGRRVVTVSEDFETKFWNLDNTMMPYYIDATPFNPIRLRMSHFAEGVFAASDEHFGIGHNRTRYVEPANYRFTEFGERRSNTNFFIVSQAACVWDLSMSDWLNVCVSCDNRGFLLGSPLADLTHNVMNSSTKLQVHRMLLLRTSLQWKGETTVQQAEGGTDSSSQNVKQSEGSSKESEHNESDKANGGESETLTLTCTSEASNQAETPLPSPSDKSERDTVNDVETRAREHLNEHMWAARTGQHSARFGIPINVKEMDEPKSFKEINQKMYLLYHEYLKEKKVPPSSDREVDDYSRFPLVSLTSVCLSPNRYTCYWLLTGGEAGLVRLINLKPRLQQACTTLVKQRDDKS